VTTSKVIILSAATTILGAIAVQKSKITVPGFSR
jgi:hypothetical protein